MSANEEKACALCGEEGYRGHALRVRVASLTGERMLAHTGCWNAPDEDDDVYAGDPSPEWAAARAAFASAVRQEASA
jgi:hypothetical protein